jgi:hypothetical protein
MQGEELAHSLAILMADLSAGTPPLSGEIAAARIAGLAVVGALNDVLTRAIVIRPATATALSLGGLLSLRGDHRVGTLAQHLLAQSAPIVGLAFVIVGQLLLLHEIR